MSPKKRRKHRKPPVTHRAPVKRRPRGVLRSADDEPDLVLDVREMLRDDQPWQLLHFVSTILATTDPRAADPLARAQAKATDQLGPLVDTFIDVALPETTALLTVLAEMVAEELVSRRIRRELSRRDHRLPSWLAPLGPLTVTGAVEMVHVLGDGDNVALGARTASGHDLTVMVYIDHNLGTVVKDGFLIPEPLDTTVASFRQAVAADADMRYDDVDLADARVRITEAIETSALLYPPLESDTWPACRALVEWIVRALPPGGTGYVWPDWSDGDRRRLTKQFFASPFGRGHEGDDRQLFDSILWFGCDYGPGDPLRWSPVAVEILLLDWLPRKVVADAAFLSRAPQLLRSFIRFSHAQRGIRAALTDETLTAVDAHESEYQQLIRSPRPQGPAALLAAMGVALGEDVDAFAGDDAAPSHREFMLDSLRRAVGGQRALDDLDDDPLPDEPLDISAVPEDITDRVRHAAALTDACCEELLGGAEARTACRRFLAAVAVADPQVFRRKGRIETAAAAVAWTVAKANDLFGSYSGGLTAGQLHAWFGLSSGASTRAATMLRALGIQAWTGDRELTLGTTRYLISAHRRELLQRRERFEAIDF